ncbi:MAG TPA: M23 family metallopeptidase [Kofleriaceae bacterium]|nr:M23 family metallopeptidase [Kofleriaceae bacterium]
MVAGIAGDELCAAKRPSRWLERCPRAGSFGFPVGGGTATGYYNAQPFGENTHLGDDWNGNGGGDTDLGDPVLAIADGVVTSADDHGGGWGKVVRVVHDVGAEGAPAHVESLYAHLDSIDVRAGTVVRRGDQVGTIGDAGGRYPAHLHLEVRDRVGLPLGRGYGAGKRGYLDPTAFILARRPASEDSRPQASGGDD